MVKNTASLGALRLAANLKRLKEKSRYLNSQEKIAQASGINQRTVGRILEAKHEATLDKVSRLAKAFGLTPWQILTPNLEPTNPPMLVNESAALRKLYSSIDNTKEAIEGLLHDEGNTRPPEL